MKTCEEHLTDSICLIIGSLRQAQPRASIEDALKELWLHGKSCTGALEMPPSDPLIYKA